MAYIKNKKINYEYKLLEKIEAGISLMGIEVKAIKSGSGTLDGAWCGIKDNQLFLNNMFIKPLQEKNVTKEYNPKRARKLLIKKSDINRLKNLIDTQPLTIIPVSLYNRRGKVKVEIALAKGKKLYDKREVLKKRDEERNIRRILKKY